MNKDTLTKCFEPLLAVSPFASEHQPTSIKYRSFPEYYNDMLSNANKDMSTSMLVHQCSVHELVE